MQRPERPFPLAVTWSHQPSGEVVADTRRVAEAWGLPLYERPHKSGLKQQLGREAAAFLVRGGTGWRLVDVDGELGVSPGLAMLRLKRLDAGSTMAEPILAHAEVRAGDVVIDATVGLGADARVLARAVGAAGRIVGVEASLPLAVLLSEGLRLEPRWPNSAPIEVRHGRALDVLRGLPSASADVVFFDPMFERTLGASPAFVALRRFADHAPFGVDVVDEARRVARRWVLMKSSDPSLFPSLGLEALVPPAGAHVFWGRARGDGNL
ncbi:MAG: class I SAM-dependent methyltransferase [Myxococcaceae bacterium]|nr:class I SAM-dependent methyltransferase [Myxococcaceae bacterium]